MSTTTAKKSDSGASGLPGADGPTPASRPVGRLEVVKGALSSAATDYLGPATAVEVHGLTLSVELPDGAVVAAEMALAIPYEACAGDSLLVIGKGDRHYVIGVLHGAGRTMLTLPGDIHVHAAGGSLSLSGDKGVDIGGPELSIHTRSILTIADTLVQKLGSLCQRVSGLLSVQAADAHTLVENTAFTKARNATLLTEETVTVNGKQIHLG